MKTEDVKIGMKVIPNKRTTDGGNFDSWLADNRRIVAYFKNNGFLIVQGFSECFGQWRLTDANGGISYFNASDFEPACIQPGDTVRVREGLGVGTDYGSAFFAPDMKEYAGKEGVITDKCCEGNPKCFHIKAFGCWHWTTNMLDLVRKGKKPEATTPAVPADTVIVALVRHSDSKPFLFEVPAGAAVKAGDDVLCDTMHGEQSGTVVHIIELTRSTLPALVATLGAYMPLKRIIGKYTTTLVRF